MRCPDIIQSLVVQARRLRMYGLNPQAEQVEKRIRELKEGNRE